VLHTLPTNSEETNVTLPPWQIVSLPTIVIVGVKGATEFINIPLEVEEHPLELV
jgi:hypothetical protein